MKKDVLLKKKQFACHTTEKMENGLVEMLKNANPTKKNVVLRIKGTINFSRKIYRKKSSQKDGFFYFSWISIYFLYKLC